MAYKLKVSDGTVGLPSMTFENDLDSGFYRIGANNMGLALGGLKKMGFGEANALVEISGTFAGSGLSSGLNVAPTLSPAAGLNAFGMDFNRVAITEAASGTHAIFATARFRSPVITGGAAALTEAATVYILDAPTGGTSNYALLVTAGAVKFGALAGSGTRNVVVDANGVLSAP